MESNQGTTWKGNGVRFTITWRDLSVYVRIRNPNFFRRNPQPCKRLINNVTGVVRAGSLVVLMGPSGSGKSTLMGALACRNSKDVFWEGDIRINGEPISKRMHQISGFMHQEDLFVGTLSVREHLQFMVRLKLGGCKSSRDINRFVDQLISEMGLTNCANTKIGRVGDEKVISGGERKRLSFATEIITDPLILFCDEPTTGLDSFSAQHLVNLMKQMTHRGKTVLCTIHQPSSELFAMFHQIILLTDGRIAFIGDTESALKFFHKHGYLCPENYNPAEIIIRVLSTTSNDRNPGKVKRLCDEFSVSETAQQIDDLITSIQDQDSDSKEYLREVTAIAERKSPSWLTKMKWLTYRSFLQVLRDPSVQTVRLLQKLGIALMASVCFFGSVAFTQAGVQSVQGAIFVLVTENTFPPMYGVLPLFPDEFPLFLREYRNNLYPAPLYYTSKILSFNVLQMYKIDGTGLLRAVVPLTAFGVRSLSTTEWNFTELIVNVDQETSNKRIAILPGLVIEPILFVFVFYFITGFKRTIYAFLMTNLIAILTTNVAAACGCFFSNAFESVSMALAFLVPFDYTLMLTSGLFIKLSSLATIIAWFRFFSWFMYSNESLTIIQWEDVHNITCEYVNPDIPCLRSGEDVLNQFEFSSSHLFQNLIVMSSMFCVFHLFGFVSLWWKANKNL